MHRSVRPECQPRRGDGDRSARAVGRGRHGGRPPCPARPCRCELRRRPRNGNAGDHSAPQGACGRHRGPGHRVRRGRAGAIATATAARETAATIRRRQWGVVRIGAGRDWHRGPATVSGEAVPVRLRRRRLLAERRRWRSFDGGGEAGAGTCRIAAGRLRSRTRAELGLPSGLQCAWWNACRRQLEDRRSFSLAISRRSAAFLQSRSSSNARS